MNMLLTITPGSMADILQQLGLIVTQLVTWAGSVLTFVVENPLVLAYVGMGVFGMAIILIKAFVHR
jgi:hypothetical protein